MHLVTMETLFVSIMEVDTDTKTRLIRDIKEVKIKRRIESKQLLERLESSVSYKPPSGTSSVRKKKDGTSQYDCNKSTLKPENFDENPNKHISHVRTDGTSSLGYNRKSKENLVLQHRSSPVFDSSSNKRSHLMTERCLYNGVVVSPGSSIVDSCDQLNRQSCCSLESTGSTELCRTIFNEWLAKKEQMKMSANKASKEQRKKEEEDRLMIKNAKVHRTQQVVETWKIRKSKDAKEKMKKINEDEVNKKIKDEEKRERIQQAEMASNSWRDIKGKEVEEKQQEKITKEKEEKRLKVKDDSERLLSSELAFKAWADKKEQLLKESLKQKLLKERQLHDEKINLQKSRQTESASAYLSWKMNKDKKIKETGKLYTYNGNPRKPPKDTKWCPARGIQYSYPRDKHAENISKMNSSVSRKSKSFQESLSNGSHIDQSYRFDSFDSDNCSSDDNSLQSPQEFNDSTLETNLKASPIESVNENGQMKSVQVCCKTIEYICICDKLRDEDSVK